MLEQKIRINAEVSKYYPQLGHIKVNLLLMTNINEFETILCWNVWTVKKIINVVITKSQKISASSDSCELLTINIDRFNSIISQNDSASWKEKLNVDGHHLNRELPIGTQMNHMTFREDSFPDTDDVILIYDRSLMSQLVQDTLMETPSPSRISQEKIAAINDYFMENMDQDLPSKKIYEHDDLVNLAHLSEDVLLKKLYKRYRMGCFYCYVDNILIFLNPYYTLPIYNPRYSNMYKNHKIEDNPPHVFGFTDQIYYHMMENKMHQFILISGESGGGKTETSKQIIQHLTFLDQFGFQSKISSSLLASSCVLEAFGNACTSQNKNSSRFGKFIEILFSPNGNISGANMRSYLLEKSRITSHNENERNFHIFYYLMANKRDTQSANIMLHHPSDFEYLKPLLLDNYDTPDDDCAFKKLRYCLGELNFSNETQTRIFAIVLALLYIGNIKIRSKEADDTEIDPAIIVASNHLKINSKRFDSLFFGQSQHFGEEEIWISFSESRIKEVRDSTTKIIYSLLFEWIMKKINYELRRNYSVANNNLTSIKVLDIFGFENMKENSFQQFCVNYVSECLQIFMDRKTLKAQQDEYEEEGLHWQRISHTDNSDVVNLFVSKPHGLWPLLEDECKLRDGTDENLLKKMTIYFKNNPSFSVNGLKNGHFVVKHYAADVDYNITGFRQKNLNYINKEILDLLEESECPIVREITCRRSSRESWRLISYFFKAVFEFQRGLTRGSVRSESEALKMTSQSEMSLFLPTPGIKKQPSILDRKKKLGSVKTLRKDGDTYRKKFKNSINEREIKQNYGMLSNYIQASINELFISISQCECYFIKCIKPNDESKPLVFDKSTVTTQLKYTGLIQTIMLRQAGYGYRYKKSEFMEKYKVILKNIKTDDDLANFFIRNEISTEWFKIGKTKMFLKNQAKTPLLRLKNKKILDYIIILQYKCRSLIRSKTKIGININEELIQSFLLTCHHVTQFKKFIKNQLDVSEKRFRTKHCFAERKNYMNTISAPHEYRRQASKMMFEESKIGESHLFGKKRANTDENVDEILDKSYDESLSTNQHIHYENISVDLNKKKSVIKQETFSSEWSLYEPPVETLQVKDKTSKNRFTGFKTYKFQNYSSKFKLNNIIGTLRRTPTMLRSKAFNENDSRMKTVAQSIAQSIQFTSSILEPITIISSHEELFSYYSFFTKKILQIRENNAKKNADTSHIKYSLEDFFYRCLSSHVASMFIKLKDTYNNKTFIPFLNDDLYEYFIQECGKLSAALDKNLASPEIFKNAFEGILDEFMNKKDKIFSKKEYTKILKEFKDNEMRYKSHILTPYKVYNNPACEICGKQIWASALICQECKTLLHKDCKLHIKFKCRLKQKVEETPNFFGVPLETICSIDNPVPPKLAELFKQVEERGIRLEGIYRKTGNTKKIKEVYALLDTCAGSDFSFLNDISIHVISNIIKYFFRELPKSLIPEEFNSDILNASNLKYSDMCMKYWALLSSLSIINRKLLEALAKHLAIICNHQEANKMSENAISIVFTPCLFKQIEGDYSSYVSTLTSKTKFVEFLIAVQNYNTSNNKGFQFGEGKIPDEILENPIIQ